CPPSPEMMKNGVMKIASASVFSEAAPVLPIWNTMRNPSAFLRKLSLNAEKNWHQNSGAKRRDVMRFVDMVRAFYWSDGGAEPRRGEKMSGAINPMDGQGPRRWHLLGTPSRL